MRFATRMSNAAIVFPQFPEACMKVPDKSGAGKPAQKTASKIITKDKTQQQIDLILDKISKSGYDSLDQSEKEFLFKMGSN